MPSVRPLPPAPANNDIMSLPSFRIPGQTA